MIGGDLKLYASIAARAYSLNPKTVPPKNPSLVRSGFSAAPFHSSESRE
jgi:hypothetical protein